MCHLIVFLSNLHAQIRTGSRLDTVGRNSVCQIRIWRVRECSSRNRMASQTRGTNIQGTRNVYTFHGTTSCTSFHATAVSQHFAIHTTRTFLQPRSRVIDREGRLNATRRRTRSFLDLAWKYLVHLDIFVDGSLVVIARNNRTVARVTFKRAIRRNAHRKEEYAVVFGELDRKRYKHQGTNHSSLDKRRRAFRSLVHAWPWRETKCDFISSFRPTSLKSPSFTCVRACVPARVMKHTNLNRIVSSVRVFPVAVDHVQIQAWPFRWFSFPSFTRDVSRNEN